MKQVDIQHLLPLVDKPARYLDHELNACRKDFSAYPVRFAFAFPEVYELGVSHLGLKILYSIVNKLDYAMADRAYLPWLDLSGMMREEKLPLFGWETRVQLKDFDVLGITLQSELTYSNVLELIDLSGLELRRENRTANDPIVLVGGPCASNPLPLSPFIDAFFIGEAEEGIIQIAEIMRDTQDKESRLKRLSGLDSCYVPGFNDGHEITCRKFTAFSESTAMHHPQLLSWQLATHNRYVAEIMRGCSRGCRFCHAGYFYRPVRERNPEHILKELLQEVQASGWDEAGLVSLSSADYTCIQELLISLLSAIDTDKTHISLPSLRVDSLSDELVTVMQKLGREGLTLAPEAGSERLRRVINKNLSETDILKGVEIAIRLGWQRIKLYFMLGLPTEDDPDIEAIIELISKINTLGKGKLQIGVTLSPFVPKPFTPFQWAPMLDATVLLNRAYRIKNAFGKTRNIRIKYHTIESSLLEAVLSRGDEKLGRAIEAAWKDGARFDAWNECFSFNIWQKAFETAQISYLSYLQARSEDQALPWDFVHIGVSDRFLREEWQKARSAEETEDCRYNCSVCGVCGQEVQTDLASIKGFETSLPPITESKQPLSTQDLQHQFRYRIYYQKLGYLRFISHLDWMRMLFRRIAVLNLKTVFTQGFSPHPKVSLSPPLPVGVEGLQEFFDISFLVQYSPQEIIAAFQKTQIPDFVLLSCEALLKKGALPLTERISIDIPAARLEEAKSLVARFFTLETLPYTKSTETRNKTYDLRQLILDMELMDSKLIITKRLESPSLYGMLEAITTWDKKLLYTMPVSRLEFGF